MPTHLPPTHRRDCKTAKYTKLDYLGEYIPSVNWLRTYKWKQWLLVSSRPGGCALAFSVCFASSSTRRPAVGASMCFTM